MPELPALPALPADQCPRCGESFHCGIGDAAAPCPCAAVSLDAALQRQLRVRYDGCLCVRCLKAMAGAPKDGLPVAVLTLSAA